MSVINLKEKMNIINIFLIIRTIDKLFGISNFNQENNLSHRKLDLILILLLYVMDRRTF